jgi:hypothetical protein
VKALLALVRRELAVLLHAVSGLNTDHGIHHHLPSKPPR